MCKQACTCVREHESGSEHECLHVNVYVRAAVCASVCVCVETQVPQSEPTVGAGQSGALRGPSVRAEPWPSWPGPWWRSDGRREEEGSSEAQLSPSG